MLRSEITTIEISNQTIKFSGRSLIVVNLSQIVELLKGRQHPANVGWYLMCALIAALAVCGLGVVLSDRIDAVAALNLRETLMTIARYAGAGLAIMVIVRTLVWVFRRETYGLMIGTAAGGWYTVSSKSDDVITSILEAVAARMESQQQMPNVTFTADKLEVSTRPANNVISHFVSAGRDAAVGKAAKDL